MRVSVGRQDRHWWLGVAALFGLVAGGVMAVFGLPPVDLHGPLHYVGIMDPFCGGTRGVHAMMQGDVSTALRYNPLSVVLVIGAVGVLARQAVGLLGRRWLNIEITNRKAVLAVVIALAVPLTINQQANSDLLMEGSGRFSPLLPLLNLIVAGSTVLYLQWRFKRPAARTAG